MIDDEGAKRLALNASWINLSELDLSNNIFGDKRVEGLAKRSLFESKQQQFECEISSKTFEKRLFQVQS